MEKKLLLRSNFWLLTAFFLAVFLVVLGSNIAWGADNSEIKDDIKNIEKKLEQEEQAKNKLEQELGKIQWSVSSTQKEIQKTESMLKDTRETISRKERELKQIDERIKFQNKILKDLIQKMYYNRKHSLLGIVLSQDSFTQILESFDGLWAVEKKIIQISEEIKKDKEKAAEDKKTLVDKEDEHEKLLALKEDQENDLLADARETKSDIAEKEATIGELNAKLSKLRSNLSGYLGKSYDAKDISDAANFASKATGARKDFIMGMLVVESDLGRFTGGCYAKDSRMSGRRLELFKDICEELDYDWKKRKVSCPPRGYTGTGGAMGVAQFMSDTWAGYKSSIARTTGHNPPDPWNLTDGVSAMALKLAKVPGVTAHKRSGECNAAKLYLSGTTSSKYDWYCQKVLYWADNYERLLD